MRTGDFPQYGTFYRASCLCKDRESLFQFFREGVTEIQQSLREVVYSSTWNMIYFCQFPLL